MKTNEQLGTNNTKNSRKILTKDMTLDLSKVSEKCTSKFMWFSLEGRAVDFVHRAGSFLLFVISFL